jgi:choline dehydrogenase
VQEGVGYYQRTMRHGRHASTARSFLRPIMRRANLRVVTNAVVRRLRFTGMRVAGIDYRRGGELISACAGREVIPSAGAIGSPHLMQISGIGDPDLLREIGVEVRHALPGVVEGLQDHYAVRVARRLTQPITLNERARGMRLYWERPCTSPVLPRRPIQLFHSRASLRTAAASILLVHSTNWSVYRSLIGGISFNTPSSLYICT